jgi:hypothetical protein
MLHAEATQQVPVGGALHGLGVHEAPMVIVPVQADWRVRVQAAPTQQAPPGTLTEPLARLKFRGVLTACVPPTRSEFCPSMGSAA